MNSVLNRYDNEYIGLLNEIGNRLIYFNGEEKLKIKTWIKILSMPNESEEEKKNRNLYTIKLVNQMINGKIKYPFNTYANINELKPFLAINLKAELTPKFYKEINMKNIINNGYQIQNQFFSTHPDFYNKINNYENTKDLNDNKEYINNIKKSKTISYSDYLNNINLKKKIKEEFNDIKVSFNNRKDINDENIQKLYYKIDGLENKIKEYDKIIEYQNNEIKKLHNILETLMNQININDNNE